MEGSDPSLVADPANDGTWYEVVELLPVGVALLEAIDPDRPETFRVMELNRTARACFATGEAILGRLRGLAADRDDEHGAALRRALREGSVTRVGDLEGTGPVGAGRIFELGIFPLAQERFGVVLEDVTAARHLQRDQLELLGRSVDASGVERERLAGQLHDDVVQLLTAALLRLDLAQMSTPDEQYGMVREPLDEAVRSLRRTMHELAPAEPGVDGLEAAIDTYAELLLESEGVEVTLSIGVDDETTIPPAILLTANRIVQEAVTNIRRHAAATRATISLELIGDELVGRVEDDGRGLDGDVDRGEQGTRRPGLRLMADRAALVGGSVSIAARPGGGTVVSFHLPRSGVRGRA